MLEKALAGRFALQPRSFGGSLSGMARKNRSSVTVGRRFERNGVEWEVGRLTSTPDTIPHVEIFKVEDPTERKFISVGALLDDNDFVLLEEQS